MFQKGCLTKFNGRSLQEKLGIFRICYDCMCVPRPEGAADVRYAEGSMKNGFGLMHLHKFLSIPFLQLQVSHTHQKVIFSNTQQIDDLTVHTYIHM